MREHRNHVLFFLLYSWCVWSSRMKNKKFFVQLKIFISSKDIIVPRERASSEECFSCSIQIEIELDSSTKWKKTNIRKNSLWKRINSSSNRKNKELLNRYITTRLIWALGRWAKKENSIKDVFLWIYCISYGTKTGRIDFGNSSTLYFV